MNTPSCSLAFLPTPCPLTASNFTASASAQPSRRPPAHERPETQCVISPPKLPSLVTLPRRAPQTPPQNTPPQNTPNLPPTPPDPSHPNPPRRLSGPRGATYYANVGTAIELLRETYPHLLDQPPCTFFLTCDVALKLPHMQAMYGLTSYKSLHWALRVHAKLFIRSPRLSIVSMFYDDCEAALRLRWRLSGSLRVASADDVFNDWTMDGMSVYRFDMDGYVCEHELDSWISKKIMEEQWAFATVFQRVPVVGKVVTGSWFEPALDVGIPVGAGGALDIASDCVAACDCAENFTTVN